MLMRRLLGVALQADYRKVLWPVITLDAVSMMDMQISPLSK